MDIKIVFGELPTEKIPKTPAKLLIPQEHFAVALCQVSSKAVTKKEEWNENLKKALKCMEIAAEAKADLVVFPETYISNYMAQSESRYFAETVPGPTTNLLVEYAKKYNIYVIMGMPVMVKKFPGLIKNSAAVVGPEGVMGEYSKLSLPTGYVPDKGLLTEGNYWTPGLSLPIFKMRGWTVGINICRDCFVPEIPRILALQGAQIIVTVSASRAEKKKEEGKNGWSVVLATRAIENAVFQCYCNTVGTCRGATFFGGSRVIAPTGEVIVQGPMDEEAMIIGTMNINTLYDWRCMHPTFRLGYDRPCVYELVTKTACE